MHGEDEFFKQRKAVDRERNENSGNNGYYQQKGLDRLGRGADSSQPDS
jgi:hypothetical protein